MPDHHKSIENFDAKTTIARMLDDAVRDLIGAEEAFNTTKARFNDAKKKFDDCFDQLRAALLSKSP